MKVSKSIFISY